METHKIIWRDDDIAFAHTYHQTQHLDQEEIFYRFCEVDKLFKKHNVSHTIAVIAKDIDKAEILVEYIKANKHIDVQLHCWEHLHYPHHLDLFEEHLMLGVEKLQKVFNKQITTFYPPYNDVVSKMINICKANKIELSYSKMDLQQYLKGMDRNIINFHYWSDECKDLETALIKYKNENK